MKYFTPELYVALQECESPAAALEANARWERAVKRYHAQLTELRHAPPQQSIEGRRLVTVLNRLIDLGSLHDAEVREMGTTEGKRLVLVLREENRVGTLLLTYSLVETPSVNRDAIPPEHRSLPRIWLYDELEREAGITFPVRHAGRDSEFPVFRHSILLSDGIELGLRFYRLEVMEVHPLVNAEQSARPGGKMMRTTA